MSRFPVSLLVLCIAGAARAAPVAGTDPAPRLLTLTLRHDTALRQEPVFHAGRGRAAVGVIASDALYGLLIGVVIGTGVALINNDFNNGGWGRDLSIGAGVGLVIGGIVGAAEVVTSSDRSMPVATRGERNRGFGKAAGLHAQF